MCLHIFTEADKTRGLVRNGQNKIFVELQIVLHISGGTLR